MIRGNSKGQFYLGLLFLRNLLISFQINYFLNYAGNTGMAFITL